MTGHNLYELDLSQVKFNHACGGNQGGGDDGESCVILGLVEQGVYALGDSKRPGRPQSRAGGRGFNVSEEKHSCTSTATSGPVTAGCWRRSRSVARSRPHGSASRSCHRC
ncbi:hypothetical protein [Kitasatospora sp. NPDC056731]|uniref:hypothetical protein n=1 Tax=Kitasatospora sp. NPDC056731 TaxID=3155422 RepID=UPI00343F6F73